MLYNSKIHRLAVLSALLFLVVSAVFIACKKDEDGQDNGNTSTTEITVSIFGSVRDGNGVALSGVTLKAGTSTITSDANGLFILEKVKVPKGRYYVSAEKSGYYDSGRGGLAKEGEYYSVNIVMLSRGTAVNLNAATGGVVNTANNSSLTFPTGAIVTAGGQAYTGNVKVYSQYLMPGTASFEDRIPGGDLACQNANGELSPLVSYGMIGVELEDNSGNPLNIATGKTVSVRFPIANSQLATAPASIPLLSFDTDKGVWIQEGTAIKNGNYYEGEVSHFSWWNCDVLNNPPPPLISGSVVDCNGTPIPGIMVTVNGMYNMVTNSQGQYSSWIIPGIFTLQVLSIYNGGILNSSPVIISVSSGNISVPVLTVPCPAYVSAQALDCNNNNTLAYGRAVWSGGASNVQVSTSGSFKFAVPANLSITVQLFDGKANANTIITSGNLNTTVSAGNVILCNLGGGGNCAGGPTSVTDIDGNVYNVVTVGNQCWMKENLKTTKYKNGTVIPGSLSDAAWSNTTSGAQADYNNDPAYTNIYGKLYNWYAVADPAGLCPTGWHIPSKSEWHELTKFLDPSADTILLLQSTIAGGLLKSNGNLQDGTGIWEAPNTDATNTTGFTGLPAGVRDTTGTYADIGVAGYWWSSSPFSTNESWCHYVMYSNGWIARHFPPNNCGYSVRCLRN
jgi:uncharacterized protein (TIGR02145 family)